MVKTIFYLIDLADRKEIQSYQGVDDTPPDEAIRHAKGRAERTGNTHVLAVGTLFFEKSQPMMVILRLGPLLGI